MEQTSSECYLGVTVRMYRSKSTRRLLELHSFAMFGKSLPVHAKPCQVRGGLSPSVAPFLRLRRSLRNRAFQGFWLYSPMFVFRSLRSTRGRSTSISTSKVDATVINHMFRDSAMILPHRRLALLTGEFRNQDHSKYMAPDEDEDWNVMGEVSRSVLVHFSDWPLPEPWISRSNNLWESMMPPFPVNEPEHNDRRRCADQVM